MMERQIIQGTLMNRFLPWAIEAQSHWGIRGVNKTHLMVAHTRVRSMGSLSSGRQLWVISLRIGGYVGEDLMQRRYEQDMDIHGFMFFVLVVAGLHLNGQ